MHNPLSLTPTEIRILLVLSDGKRHPRDEMMQCLNDDMADPSVLWNHMSNTRAKLAEVGQTILCEVNSWRHYYRWVVFLVPSDIPEPVFSKVWESAPVPSPVTEQRNLSLSQHDS